MLTPAVPELHMQAGVGSESPQKGAQKEEQVQAGFWLYWDPGISVQYPRQ